jgi:hypothetical protein
VQAFFTAVAAGSVEETVGILEHNDIREKLCHPLCSCERCQQVRFLVESLFFSVE